MAYTSAKGIDFWFEYDNTFLLDVPQDVAQAYASLGGSSFLDKPRTFLKLRRTQGTYPQRFIQDMTPLRDGLLRLADRQLQLIDAHFPDPADLQLAFEEFAQGILWDDRRVDDGIPLHMMDGVAASLVGYHRWNGIIRATILLGADEGRWLTINRFVALACAIQTLLRPAQNSPDNPPIEPGVLQALREKWLPMNADQLDAEFGRLPIVP
ncbi:MAG TPA: hypothetical protein VJ725_27895 [Thermoanaerobaculia bacterium]|nr:hypothetical protein [Thermoanaerobaculia bacterium]